MTNIEHYFAANKITAKSIDIIDTKKEKVGTRSSCVERKAEKGIYIN